MDGRGIGATLVALSALGWIACQDTGASGPVDGAPPVDAAVVGRVDADAAITPDSAPVTRALRAGAASVEFTPEPGVPLGGYGGEPRRTLDEETLAAHLMAIYGTCRDPTPEDAAALFAPAVGTLDPLTAKVLVLDSGAAKAALIKIDAVGVSRKIRDDLVAAATPLGIAPENLLMAGTHTHAGPGAMTENKLFQLAAMDCFHQQTYDRIRDRIVSALQQADAALQPARIGFGAVDETGASENRTGRPGVYDPALTVIKVVDAQGAPLAAVLNFAVHGTCLGEDNMRFSADLMGYAERGLEQQLGGGVALFLNAAEGDVSPAAGGIEGAEQVGTLLADRAATLWPAVQTEELIPIAGALDDLQMPTPALHPSIEDCFPIDDQTTSCDYLPGFKVPIADWMPSEVAFGALRLGPAVLAAVPGEPITDIGTAIKARGAAAGFERTLVIGLANDHIGYINTASEYQREEYESIFSFYGETLGEVVVEALGARIDRLAEGLTTDR